MCFAPKPQLILLEYINVFRILKKILGMLTLFHNKLFLIFLCIFNIPLYKKFKRILNISIKSNQNNNSAAVAQQQSTNSTNYMGTSAANAANTNYQTGTALALNQVNHTSKTLLIKGLKFFGLSSG